MRVDFACQWTNGGELAFLITTPLSGTGSNRNFSFLLTKCIVGNVFWRNSGGKAETEAVQTTQNSFIVLDPHVSSLLYSSQGALPFYDPSRSSHATHEEESI